MPVIPTSSRVPGQPWLHSKTNNNKKRKKLKRNQGDGHESQSFHGFLRQGLVERIHDLIIHFIELQGLSLEATATFLTNPVSKIWTQAQRIHLLFQACFGVNVSDAQNSVAYPSVFLNIIFKVILFLCSLSWFSS